ncbi:MAG: hypothetical protein KME26_31265 [Oscillatoria princeps RMCB-10]|nr:hypothetical protein [Oscillatoria princeps RMCB-10]
MKPYNSRMLVNLDFALTRTTERRQIKLFAVSGNGRIDAVESIVPDS